MKFSGMVTLRPIAMAVVLWLGTMSAPVLAHDGSVSGDVRPNPAVHEDDQSGPVPGGGAVTFRIYGYDEGLVGHTTSNGHVIQPNDHFVALPCFCVLSSKGGNEFQVKIEYKGRTVIAPVWDVGPWNVTDNYWDPPSQRTYADLPQGYPEAAAAFYRGYNHGKDGWDRMVTSPGGIDIADGTFADLGMTGSDWVNVTFLWLTPPHYDLPDLPLLFSDISTRWWDERPPLDLVASITDGRYGYVPETGHNIPFDMLSYWYANGGWRTFGLPITEFFRQPETDGAIRFVQYFERSVLELHLPEDGAPAWVTADLLGYQTYIDPTARQPIAAYDSNDSSHYFPETQHSLSNGFKGYWERNGGLPVFGYPLSEEWTEIRPDGRKVVMQVFERARFEWWPDRVGTDEEITLGLLTREILQRDGWID